VAHAIAFAAAAEAASDAAPPPRAVSLRAVMAEMERAGSHLADIAGLAEAAGMPLAVGPCLAAREALLRAGRGAFGHRLMMDAVIPGGVATELAPAAEEGLRAAAGALGGAIPGIMALCEPLSRRLEGVGAVAPARVAALAPGGPAGRAGGWRYGRDCDLRRGPGYVPYPGLAVPPPREGAGDAAARLGVWLMELRDSARMLRGLLAELPGGPVVAALPQASGEGFGFAEGARGDIWTWVRLEAGQVAGVFMRDPGWLHLPMLEAAAEGAEVADWAVIRASFGVSVAGVDL
jgi:Ni,Fe-hydrogenase III large subunit